jgi:hypothetical protein
MDDGTHLNACPRPNCIDNHSLKNRWTIPLGTVGQLECCAECRNAGFVVVSTYFFR